MDHLASFHLTLLALLVIALYRNNLVFKHRTRRLYEIKVACDLQLSNRNFLASMERYYAEYNKVSYGSMLFDVTKWTYKQFYPNPVE